MISNAGLTFFNIYISFHIIEMNKFWIQHNISWNIINIMIFIQFITGGSWRIIENSNSSLKNACHKVESLKIVKWHIWMWYQPLCSLCQSECQFWLEMRLGKLLLVNHGSWGLQRSTALLQKGSGTELIPHITLTIVVLKRCCNSVRP